MQDPSVKLLEALLADPAKPLEAFRLQINHTKDGVTNTVGQRRAYKAFQTASGNAASWAGPDADALLEEPASVGVFGDVVWGQVGASAWDPASRRFRPWQSAIDGWRERWEDLRKVVTDRFPDTPASCWPGAWWWPSPFANSGDLYLVLLPPPARPTPTKAYTLFWPHAETLDDGRQVRLDFATVQPDSRNMPWRASRKECETLYWGALVAGCFFLAVPAGAGGSTAPKKKLKEFEP